MDRALGFGPRGSRFKSWRGRKKSAGEDITTVFGTVIGGSNPSGDVSKRRVLNRWDSNGMLGAFRGMCEGHIESLQGRHILKVEKLYSVGLFPCSARRADVSVGLPTGSVGTKSNTRP